MLVLTRKANEQIRLGEDVVVTVLRVKGNTVRLGIEAPRSVRVVRGELPPNDFLEISEEEPAGSNAAKASFCQTEDDVEPPARPRTLKDYLSTAHAV